MRNSILKNMYLFLSWNGLKIPPKHWVLSAGGVGPHDVRECGAPAQNIAANKDRGNQRKIEHNNNHRFEQ